MAGVGVVVAKLQPPDGSRSRKMVGPFCTKRQPSEPLTPATKAPVATTVSAGGVVVMSTSVRSPS
jgi:hypothetical protein